MPEVTMMVFHSTPSQPDNILFDIYKGGNDDGFSVSSFAQPDNVLFDIYKGGNEDGFSFSSFAQPDNVLYDIYKGGNEDGFSFSSFAQPDNVLYFIYSGGSGDGFAFSTLGGIGTEVPLPIELISFEALVVNGTVVLKWETASELNNDFFTVERSVKGEVFEAVMKIPGAGTTQKKQIYQVEDKFPHIGRSYYRLSQTDYDGSITYSQIVLVDIQEVPGGVMAIYPNPLSNTQNLTVQYYAASNNDTIKIAIFDAVGKLLSIKEYQVAQGNNAISLEAGFSSSGVFLLQVYDGARNQGYRLVVY